MAKLSDKWSGLLAQLDSWQRRLDETLPVSLLSLSVCYVTNSPYQCTFRIFLQSRMSTTRRRHWYPSHSMAYPKFWTNHRYCNMKNKGGREAGYCHVSAPDLRDQCLTVLNFFVVFCPMFSFSHSIAQIIGNFFVNRLGALNISISGDSFLCVL